MRVADLLEPAQSRITNDAAAGRDPPVTGDVLKHDLIPAPAPIGNRFWERQPRGRKPLAVEAVYVSFAADRAKFAVAAFKDRADANSSEAIRFVEGSESVGRQLHRAAAFAAYPQIALAIFGQRCDVRIAQAVCRVVPDKAQPVTGWRRQALVQTIL